MLTTFLFSRKACSQETCSFNDKRQISKSGCALCQNFYTKGRITLYLTSLLLLKARCHFSYEANKKKAKQKLPDRILGEFRVASTDTAEWQHT